MSAIIMHANEIAKAGKETLKTIIKSYNLTPKLAIISVGYDPASKTYINGKKKDCKEIGIECDIYHPEPSSDEIIKCIHQLNNDQSVTGILVQLPLPKNINKELIMREIDPSKDVDCFHPLNVATLFQSDPLLAPCTPGGIIHLLKMYDISIPGKNCVVIGRSDIVGKPMATLLTHKDATVTLCHSKTKDISMYTKNADIIISAVGKPKFITADMVNENAVVIDVGINRDENGKLCGDVDFEEVSKKCYAITPVPGGVGLMTRLQLLENIVDFAIYQEDVHI